MYYQIYELNHAALQPFRAYADAVRLFYRNPLNPLSTTPVGRSVAAAAEVFERTTRRYGKPGFDLPATEVDGREVAVDEKVVWSRPFCDLIHFQRDLPGLAPLTGGLRQRLSLHGVHARQAADTLLVELNGRPIGCGAGGQALQFREFVADKSLETRRISLLELTGHAVPLATERLWHRA